MTTVLLSGDLMVVAAAQGAVDRQGGHLAVVRDAEAALAACADEQATLLAVDLRTSPLDIRRLLDELRASSGPRVHVLAFGPHVHEVSLRSAAEAGCDEVVARGEFERRLEAAVARLASRTG
jgi:CheY-like chemotaxis protein